MTIIIFRSPFRTELYQHEIYKEKEKIEELGRVLSDTNEIARRGINDYLFKLESDLAISRINSRISDLELERDNNSKKRFKLFYKVLDSFFGY